MVRVLCLVFFRQLGLSVEIADDPRKAVPGCDIVVTSGPILKVSHETIQAGWIDPGTFAANLGLAMDDMAVAPLIYKRAVEKKIGTWLSL
jgi:ornithine cyclodeaminase/alanine dehydrogenase-like protein (mu-crystallin family)